MDSPALCPSGIVRGNLNHQASSGGTPPAMPRIDSRECFPDGTEGKNKTDLPSNLKWQIGLFLWLRVARVQAKRSTNEGGKFAPGDSKGRSPWRAFGDFPRDGKVTRVPSMAKPCSRGAPALVDAGATSRGYQQGLQPRKSPGVEGRSALHSEGVGAVLPQWGAGAKSDDLLPRGRSPLASFSRNAPFPPGPCVRCRGGRGRPARSRRSPAPGC